MTQLHATQEGLFLVTTNARGRVPWLTWSGVPERLIRQLVFTRNLYGARLYAFCVLPDHMHIILNPGERGLSIFLQSFKANSMRDIRQFLSGVSGQCALSAEDWDMNSVRWQRGFDSRILSGSRTIENALAYVRHNALHHHLVESTDDWPWSFIHYSPYVDEMEWF